MTDRRLEPALLGRNIASPNLRRASGANGGSFAGGDVAVIDAGGSPADRLRLMDRLYLTVSTGSAAAKIVIEKRVGAPPGDGADSPYINVAAGGVQVIWYEWRRYLQADGTIRARVTGARTEAIVCAWIAPA